MVVFICEQFHTKNPNLHLEKKSQLVAAEPKFDGKTGLGFPQAQCSGFSGGGFGGRGAGGLEGRAAFRGAIHTPARPSVSPTRATPRPVLSAHGAAMSPLKQAVSGFCLLKWSPVPTGHFLYTCYVPSSAR